MASQLFDIRIDLFRRAFEAAKPYADFVETAPPQHRERWNISYERNRLTADQVHVAEGFTRKMNVLVLAGTWCGDCSRQCPMIQRIGEASAMTDVRFIDNEAIPELRDELRIHGASRVPVALVLSEDFFEVSRFGDRMLSVYRRKARTELGAACDIGSGSSAEELQTELSEWVQHFERAQLMLRLSPFLRKRHND